MDILDIQKKLEAGWLFLHPTDTLPGIGCLSSHKETIQKLSAIKKVKDNRLGFIGLVGSFEQAEIQFSKLHEHCSKFLKKFWPGPLTFVHESKQSGTLALRFPHLKQKEMEWFSELLAWAPSPLISTSVNISGHAYANNWDEAVLFSKEHEIENIIVPHIKSITTETIPQISYPSTIIKGNQTGELSILRQGDPVFIEKILKFDPTIKKVLS